MKQLGLNRSLWIPKWLAGFAPVGKVLQRNKHQDHAECPRCTNFETTAHVLLCPAPNAQRQWDASIAMLALWLTKAKTPPEVQHAILQRLTAWRTNATVQTPSYTLPGVNDLVLSQDLLGWRTFLEGGIL